MISDGVLKKLHISACTADVTEENEIKCKNLNFDSILFKPVVFAELNELIQLTLN